VHSRTALERPEKAEEIRKRIICIKRLQSTNLDQEMTVWQPPFLKFNNRNNIDQFPKILFYKGLEILQSSMEGLTYY
jgi:hypothetical protein